MTNDARMLGYAVVVVLRGHDREIVSPKPIPEADAEAELDKLLNPGDEKGLVKVAGMVIDPKDVKAAFLREVRPDLVEQLAERTQRRLAAAGRTGLLDDLPGTRP